MARKPKQKATSASKEQPVVKVQFMPDHHSFKVPQYQTKGAAAVDLEYSGPPVWLKRNGERNLLGTKMMIEIPEGYEGQIRPRSGLALKHGFTVLNTPGTIDSDYRGEVKVILVSNSNQKLQIKAGDRIAQLVIAPVTQAKFVAVEELSSTDRGANGFGSTGVSKEPEQIERPNETPDLPEGYEILLEGDEK